MSTSGRSVKNALSLTHFIRRSKTLNLYRDFFRLTRQVEDKQHRADLRAWIRDEFHSRKQTTDSELIEMHLTRGREALRDLEVSLRHAHVLK